MFCAHFNRYTSLIATGSLDKTCRLWDPRIGKCVRSTAVHSAAVTSVHFSFDSNQLITSSFDGSWYVICESIVLYVTSIFIVCVCVCAFCSRVWDVLSGQCINTISDPTGVPVYVFCTSNFDVLGWC